MRRIRRQAVCIFAAAALVAGGPGLSRAATASRHMIVAAEPEAAAAGLEMLRAGGSAVDAIIAAQMVLTVVEPQSSGVGGGSYLLVADGPTVHAYDGRETAPASARPDMFLDASGKPRGHFEMVPGGLSVGVPGTVAVLALAHDKHGHLPWAKLFEPAIALADKGFHVSPRLARELAQGGPRLAAMPGIKANFTHPDGTLVKEGEIWRNPKLADSLRQIAQGGPEAFYKGAIAKGIAAAVSSAPVHPAVMTEADIASYRAKERDPLCRPYRSYRVCSMPLSSSGGTAVLEILGLLQRFPSSQLQPATLSTVHLMSEASWLAYTDRDRWLGDSAFVMAPVEGLLDPAYLGMRSLLIDPAHAMAQAMAGEPMMKKAQVPDYAPMPQQIEQGTSHLDAVDDSGEAVSMTTTIEAGFGSELSAGGFLLNNELTDFSFAPVIDGRPVANAPAAGKRPLSSTAPTIIFGPDGKFFAAVGSPGGRQIIGYVAQAIVNLIDGRLSMPAAAAAPRHVDINGTILIERGTILENLTPQLTGMGHRVRAIPFDSGVNGIRRTDAGYEGGADPRREGVALGD